MFFAFFIFYFVIFSKNVTPSKKDLRLASQEREDGHCPIVILS